MERMISNMLYELTASATWHNRLVLGSKHVLSGTLEMLADFRLYRLRD